jgi:hypothetical protein
MRIKTRDQAQEAIWSSLLEKWSGYQASIAADWGLLLGLNPSEVVWLSTDPVADGLRLQFQSDLGFVWADLTGSPSSSLRVALRWKNDQMTSILHGRIYSQTAKAQWSLSEPVVIDYLPVMVVSDHDWYDLLMTKIYNDNFQSYVRNFYRLLASPNHQFSLLEGTHLVDTAYSWKSKIPEVSDQPQLLKPKSAEEQFLKYILPRHSDFTIHGAEKAVAAEKERLFQNSVNGFD